MDNIVEMVEDRIQNETWAAIDNITIPRIELAVKSINASSGRNADSVTANLERGEPTRITACFEDVSDSNNTFHEVNVNDETRGNISDEVYEFSVPRTHFGRQLLAHRKCIEV